MATRSDFHRAQLTEVETQCKRLIWGILEENATDENMETALDFCLHRFREHRFVDTDSSEVASSFAQLIEKLRTNLCFEAADHLEALHASFIRCEVSQRHTTEAHAAVLRALMLLAEQPMRVPLRVVRKLRAIGERKRAAARERQALGEQAYERQAQLQMELRHVAESASRDWVEDWVLDDPDSELVGSTSPHSPRQHRTEMLSSQPRVSVESQGPIGENGETAAGGSCSSSVTAEADEAGGAPQWKDTDSTLLNGALPRLAWQRSRGGKVEVSSGKTALVEVSHQALAEIILHLLAGHCSELVHTFEDGSVRWCPFSLPGLTASLKARAAGRAPKVVAAHVDLLSPFAEHASCLRRLRALSAVLRALAPPLCNAPLRRGISEAMKEGLSLRQVFRLNERYSDKNSSSRVAEEDTKSVVDVFGLVWQSLGLVLEGLFDDFGREMRSLHAELHMIGDGGQARIAPLTLLGLERWAIPRRRAALTVERVLDAALASISHRCMALCPERWAEAAAEDLIAHLARAAQAEGIKAEPTSSVAPADEAAGLQPSIQAIWLGRLWYGAMRPVLRVVDQWGMEGELYDPCQEFLDLGTQGASTAALLPASVASGGRQVRALRGWEPVVTFGSASKDNRWCRQWDSTSALEAAAWRSACDVSAVTPSVSSVALPPDARTTACVIPCNRGYFRPLEASLGFWVLGPAQRLAEEVSRPLLARVLQDEQCGLLRHLEAIRSVAFLEREDVASILVKHCLANKFSATACRALLVEAHAALAGDAAFEIRSAAHAAVLSARHLGIEVAAPSEDGNILANRLRLTYDAPPPLDCVLDANALCTYSSIMSLLLQVRHAQAKLVEVHSSPLFGLCGGARRSWPTSLQSGTSSGSLRAPPRSLAELARAADLLRAEMSHFLNCLEWYIRIDVLQEATRSLERQLQELANVGTQQQTPSRPHAPTRCDYVDVIDRARTLHAEYLFRLSQDCFLSQELGSVLADVEQLVSSAAALQNVLESLEEKLHPERSGAALDESRGNVLGIGSAVVQHTMDIVNFDVDSKVADRAMRLASSEVGRMQYDFRRGVRFLLQVLLFSVARSSGHKAGNFCLRLDFSGFYCGADVME